MNLTSALRRMVFVGIVLLIIASAAGSAAAPPPDTPLPLPDAIFYGTTTRDDGQLIQAGTVAATLPRGEIISGQIGEITGTGYTYSLVVPLSMYDPDNGNYAADSARTDEAISFYINDVLASFRDENGLTSSTFVIPQNAIGGAYLMDLAVVGPDAYPPGDVNANGWRDSADALLVLKYDVGLIQGVVEFPPGPRTIYLPLCDIVQDGQCNSSDALRILQCDVRLPGVDCPTHSSIVLAQATAAPTYGARLVLRTEVEAGAEPDTITVRVTADDPEAKLGAASLELRYDAGRLAPEACVENPDGSLDAAACNIGFSPDVVRLNAATIRGAGGAEAPLESLSTTVLAEATFRLLDPAAMEVTGGATAMAAKALTLA
ncbi:MAG: hypothetical protein ACE5F6_19025, partial [Anaerolineae bacterium]